MAPASNCLIEQPGLVWLSAPPFEAEPPCASQGVALLCDLSAPPWTNMATLALDESDARDAAKPGSTSRQWFAARRSLSKMLVGWRCGVEASTVRISYDNEGAPRVLGPSNQFISVASRGPLTALAVASEPIGVDIEQILDQEPAYAVLHVDEATQLATIDDAGDRRDAFLRIWTMKEAYLKACGCGFKRDPSTIKIEAYSAENARIHDGALVQPACAQWRSFPASCALAACFRAYGPLNPSRADE